MLFLSAAAMKLDCPILKDASPQHLVAALDRLVHNAYRIELDGQSMRKTNLKTGDENAQN